MICIVPRQDGLVPYQCSAVSFPYCVGASNHSSPQMEEEEDFLGGSKILILTCFLLVENRHKNSYGLLTTTKDL